MRGFFAAAFFVAAFFGAAFFATFLTAFFAATFFTAFLGAVFFAAFFDVFFAMNRILSLKGVIPIRIVHGVGRDNRGKVTTGIAFRQFSNDCDV